MELFSFFFFLIQQTDFFFQKFQCFSIIVFPFWLCSSFCALTSCACKEYHPLIDFCEHHRHAYFQNLSAHSPELHLEHIYVLIVDFVSSYRLWDFFMCFGIWGPRGDWCCFVCACVSLSPTPILPAPPLTPLVFIPPCLVALQWPPGHLKLFNPEPGVRLAAQSFCLRDHGEGLLLHGTTAGLNSLPGHETSSDFSPLPID